MESLRERVGNTLKKLREINNLSQIELGDKVNIHSTTVGRFEKGNRDTSVDSIESIAEALGYDVKIVFTEKPNVNKLKTFEA